MADSSESAGQIRRVPDDVPLDRVIAERLGTQIRGLREAQKLTQERLADEIGLTRNHVQLMESGLSDRAKGTPSNPRLSTLVAIASVLGARLRIDASRPTGLVIELIAGEESA